MQYNTTEDDDDDDYKEKEDEEERRIRIRTKHSSPIANSKAAMGMRC